MNEFTRKQVQRDYTSMVCPNSLKGPSVRGLGATLERLIFFNAKDLLRNKAKAKEDNEMGVCWWTPRQDWLLVEFCRHTSINGLFFIGKPGLHLSERIFWTIAFILGVVAAVLLIYQMWDRYNQNPVIVSFQPTEVDIDSIPFPSVSLCSINAFPKSKVKLFQEVAKGSGMDAIKAKEFLKYIRSVCSSHQSFAKEFHFAFNRGDDDSESGWNETITEDSQDEMIDFLLDHTIPCDSLIRLCILGEHPQDCRKIFKPIITDYGKCCSFNLLPLPLLLNDPHLSEKEQMNSSILNPALGTKKRWSDEELRWWKTWDYDKDGFIFKNKSRIRPFRQKRAGLLYGLSILVDPNLHESYCPVSDSQGFRFLLHNPLDMPHINDFASLIPAGKEVLIEVHPELTNADDDIREFELKDRHCYFPEERQLKFFGPYTGGNCVDECTALVLEKTCNCTYFYMPRGDDVKICNTDVDSKDHKCIDLAKVDLIETLKSECAHCDALCQNIEYRFETTMSSLQDSSMLWEDPDPTHHILGTPSWAKNKMSIVHIFVGSETVVPKLRKRMYGVTDLIANTGGILGLTLGFSVLSAAEIFYFLTLRMLCKMCRRLKRRKRSAKTIPTLRHTNKGQQFVGHQRVIRLHPSQVPFLPSSQNSWQQQQQRTRQYYYANAKPSYRYPPQFQAPVDIENRPKLS